jgi:hypothetical protein
MESELRMQHVKLPSRRFVYGVLLVGLIIVGGWAVIKFAGSYSGRVYRCPSIRSGDCSNGKQPLSNLTVYLLEGNPGQTSAHGVLQTTHTDGAGSYRFFDAPPGAVAVVAVGNYQPDTWTGTLHTEQPYCAFAAQWMPSHDIEILSPDDLSAVIGDFGGSYQSLMICPPEVR